MPKNISRNKRGRPAVRTAAGPRPARLHSVKELLRRSAPALTRVTDQAARAAFWSEWLCRHLPTELGARVCGVVERDGTLVISADRKSTRLNSSHSQISYAVFCLKKKIDLIDVSINTIVTLAFHDTLGEPL